MIPLLALLLQAASLLPFVLVHAQAPLSACQLMLVAALLVLGKRRSLPDWRLSCAAAGIAALFCLLWAFFALRFAAGIAQLFMMAVAFKSLDGWRRTRDEVHGRGGFIAALVLGAMLQLGAFGLMLSFYNADLVASAWMADNVSEAEYSESVDEDGTTRYMNIDYGSAYDNGFLDVYRIADADENTPTLVYVHGGGYVFGDKLFGDPTGSLGGFYAYLASYVNAGYNIVSVNYMHPPEARYPTPVLQLSEAMTYLKEHGSEWGLNMDNVSFAAGSAGGNIAGMYLISQTDEGYRHELGLPQTFAEGEIRSVALNCAVYDNARVGDTDNPVMDFGGDVCARSYIGTNDLKGSSAVAQSNLMSQATAAFPPCYIDDGTEYTYDEQAREFSARLEELGVTHELRIYEGEPHSFDTTDSSHALDSLSRQIAFMDAYARP